MELQKLIGPRFILPNFLKKLPYNYYICENEELKIKNSVISVNKK
jgi:hypothetical protein